MSFLTVADPGIVVNHNQFPGLLILCQHLQRRTCNLFAVRDVNLADIGNGLLVFNQDNRIALLIGRGRSLCRERTVGIDDKLRGGGQLISIRSHRLFQPV